VSPSTVRRFPIRFTGLNKAMVVLGITPGGSYVDVTDETVTVRMSWAFRARVERPSIAGATPFRGRVWGWGVHGWRGEWLVNGSSSGLVTVGIAPPARARVIGWPVALRTLHVAVDDPDGLIAALAPPT